MGRNLDSLPCYIVSSVLLEYRFMLSASLVHLCDVVASRGALRQRRPVLDYQYPPCIGKAPIDHFERIHGGARLDEVLSP